jgi:hypothetical protein
MNFTKIKHSRKDSKVNIEWTTLDGPDQRESTKHERESFDPPHPDFVKALDDLIPGVLRLLDLPSPYLSGLSVRGVTFAWVNDDQEGAVVTLLKELKDLDAPLVLNTPLFPFGATPGLEARLFDRLRAEAREYLDGKRAQTDLFRDQAKNDETTVTLYGPDGREGPTIPLATMKRAVEELTA